MRFTYAYKSSDGKRHEAAMDAASREVVFEALRAQGIKAIKVVAADGSKANGEETGEGGRASTRAGAAEDGKRTTARWVAATVLILAALAGGAWWLGGRRATALPTASPESDPQQVVMTPQGPVIYRMADPLPRQSIPGNRQRIEEGRTTIFTNAAERLLSRFAEPGRVVGSPSGEKPTEAEFRASLAVPVRVASNELTEHIDLKRIVAGLKREMRAYLAGGGTFDDYIAELERRQRLEVSYRERMEKRLEELLSPDPGILSAAAKDSKAASAQNRERLRTAYDYWLKANAQLQAMGIYPLAMPDTLRSYQMTLDIDE